MTISRRLSRSLRTFCVLFAVALILVLWIELYGPLKGAYWRTFRTPTVLHDSHIEELAVGRGVEQRNKLFEVWLRGQGTYGLRQTVSSVEGTPIGLTLVAADGKATLVLDYTRDTYGSRKFIVLPVQGMEPVSSSWPAEAKTAGESRGVAQMRLRCSTARGEPTWF